MRNYKKRTLALILASAITVAGSFAEEMYKNTLMQLEFKSVKNHSITATFYTKHEYKNNINLKKISSNTYIAILPETNSNINTTNIGGYVSNVDVQTIPYTKEQKGYTKITITTSADLPVYTNSMVYLAQKKFNLLTDSNTEQNTKINKNESTEFNLKTIKSQIISPGLNHNKNLYLAEYSTDSQANIDINSNDEQNITYSNNKNKIEFDFGQAFPFMLGGLAVLVCVILLYIQGKNKMAEVIGESPDFDFDDEPDIRKKSKVSYTNKEKNNINQSLPRNIKDKSVNMITGTIKDSSTNENDKNQEDSIPAPVDLDALYQAQAISKNNSPITETNQNNETINQETEDDLAEFLNNFSFENEITTKAKTEEQEETTYNEELYNQIIGNKFIKFSQDDYIKMKELLKSEITDDVLDEIQNYISNPIKTKKISKEKILENLITTYTLERDIFFTPEDVEALKKLISVEIDPSFVKDLRTNTTSKKIIEQNNEELKKPAPVKILHVSDTLPDLEAEMKKIGNREIISEAKQEVIYYNKDLEINTLHIADKLADIKFENPENNTYQPSYEETTVAEGYEFERLNIADSYPELKNIEQYHEPIIEQHEKNTINDEEVLLKNLSNVSFKPYYDNKSSVEKNNQTKNDKILSNEEIKKEFKNLTNFDYNFDEKETNQIENNNKTEYNNKINENAKILLEIIEAKQAKRQKKQEEIQKAREEMINELKSTPVNPQLLGSFIIENKEYKILNSFKFSEQTGLYLGKNKDGYIIAGYINDNLFNLKKYDELKTEKLQARLNEKLDDNILQYIVRIGNRKFIINTTENSMEYIMELC